MQFEGSAQLVQLTGCFNRRKLVDSETYTLKDPTVSTAVLMLDIDKFKSINDNDNFGHECGDAVLRHFADVVRSTLDDKDVFVRLGGEEFVIVLTGLDSKSAIERAEEIRRQVENAPLLYNGSKCQYTVSIGICIKDTGSTQIMDDSLRLADKNLYEAKSTGRNKVVLAAA